MCPLPSVDFFSRQIKKTNKHKKQKQKNDAKLDLVKCSIFYIYQTTWVQCSCSRLTWWWRLQHYRCVALKQITVDTWCCRGHLRRRSCTGWPEETWWQRPAGSQTAPQLHTTRGRCGLRHAGSHLRSPSRRTEWGRRRSRPTPEEQQRQVEDVMSSVCVFAHIVFCI